MSMLYYVLAKLSRFETRRKIVLFMTPKDRPLSYSSYKLFLVVRIDVIHILKTCILIDFVDF